MSQQIQKQKKKKAKTKKVSFKDKYWYTVFSPKIFNFKPIGEIIGLENNLQDRVMEATLYDFTENFNDVSLKMRFKIVKVNQEARKCETIFVGHEYTNDYVRALIGRGITKVATIMNFTTKDNYIFRLTTVCTTIKRARSSQVNIIRKIMRDVLKEFSKSVNHEKFIKGMIFSEFQNQIGRVAKSIYPLAASIITKSKLIAIPEGAIDQEVPDSDFEIVEVDVKRSRKSEMRRTERINVKKLAQGKEIAEQKPEVFSEKVTRADEEPIEEEKENK